MDLPEPPGLTPDQSAVLRGRLMSSMLADQPLARTAARRGRPLVVGAALACLLVGGGVAAAGALTVTAAERGGSDSVQVGADTLDVLYDGRRISQDDLVVLTKAGQGTFTAADVDTAHDLHATRAFDTLEELDAYSAAYVEWQKAKADGDDVEAWGTVRP